MPGCGPEPQQALPTRSLTAAALAYATESEGLEVAIYPAGRSLGKTREPIKVAEEYAVIDTVSGGRFVAGFPIGLPYDACLNNGIPPVEPGARSRRFGLFASDVLPRLRGVCGTAACGARPNAA